MIVVSAQNIHKGYGANPVLEGVTLEIKAGERVGFVGPNGAGKTTLFKLLAGLEQQDQGELFRAKGSVWAYLPQNPQYPENWTAQDVIASAFADGLRLQQEIRELERQMSLVTAEDRDLERLIHRYQQKQEAFEQLGGYTWEVRMAQVIEGLGIEEWLLSTPFVQLSGGEKTKVGLAKLLCERSDVLLLDEPTNHLDVDAMEWLEGFLKDYAGTVLLISHDRFFLDAVVTSIYHVDGGEVEHYLGNYSYFVTEREERLLRQFEAYQEQQKKIKKMQETIKRLKEWGNRSNPPNEAFHRRAKSMEKALARLERIERPRMEAERMGLSFQKTDRSGQDVLIASGLCKSYGEKCLMNGADLLLRYGERKALLGPNGCGKSTFIKMLLGEVAPDSGTVKVGASVKVGYLSQQALEGDQKQRVIDVFRETAAVSEAEARHRLARFLFYGEHVFKRIGQLSGGERMRLRLAQLVHQEINLLILDEPTNHLDIEARETLEEALADFRGSLFIVSHDRYFLQKMVNGVFWIEEGRLMHYEGTFQEAVEKRKLEKEKEKERERGSSRQGRPGASAIKANEEAKPGLGQTPGAGAKTEKQDTSAIATETRPLPNENTMPETPPSMAIQQPSPQSSPKRINTYKLAELERRIETLEARRDEFLQLLSQGSDDYTQLMEWQSELEAVEAERERLYLEWLEMQEG
ncbi:MULTISPECIES: ribosomal protection-like ABC-F family protein [Brevibacillus]|uniref:ribosomal protection-like ABC-F family protein n=1 Tax=Brevibacillus TaxID=55080 RepID=UPI001FAA9A47|nr:ABC-F family ATP-binding cassette domain-containing protein [Brevibacillus borstelensis]